MSHLLNHCQQGNGIEGARKENNSDQLVVLVLYILLVIVLNTNWGSKRECQN